MQKSTNSEYITMRIPRIWEKELRLRLNTYQSERKEFKRQQTLQRRLAKIQNEMPYHLVK